MSSACNLFECLDMANMWLFMLADAGYGNVI